MVSIDDIAIRYINLTKPKLPDKGLEICLISGNVVHAQLLFHLYSLIHIVNFYMIYFISSYL